MSNHKELNKNCTVKCSYCFLTSQFFDNVKLLNFPLKNEQCLASQWMDQIGWATQPFIELRSPLRLVTSQAAINILLFVESIFLISVWYFQPIAL